MVQRIIARQSDHEISPFVQRQPKPADKPGETTVEQGREKPKDPGNKYELNLEHKGDRYSFSLRFEIARTTPALVTGKAGPIKGTLGESKLRIKKSAGQTAAFVIAEAVANVNLEVKELAPGVSIDVNLKALEAELFQKKGEVDIDVFKVSVALKGNLTKAITETQWGKTILDTELGAKIKEGLNVTVTAMVELKLDPADAVRVARAFKLHHVIARNTEEATKAKKLIDRLNDENKVFRRRLKGGGSKLSKWARNRASRRADKNSWKIAQLQKKILKNKTATKQMTPLLRKSLEGLKIKGGRLVGKVICKVAEKNTCEVDSNRRANLDCTRSYRCN